jgi:ABC-2 type transport system ATP-binding protein
MPPIISISKLTKTYASGYQALKRVDLEIRKGEIFALLGPNGAGKTTLISIVCGIVTPTEGVVVVDGHDIERDYRATRSKIGLVPQELTTDAFESVWATVSFSRGLFGRAPNPAYIEKVLRDLSLWEKRKDKIMTLSGGMKRRVLIAKALSHEPQVLFLDEPSSGIDPQTRINLWRILEDLNRAGQTILLTTHYMEEADVLCERIAIIDHGKTLAVDTPAELKRKHGAETVITLTLEGDPGPLAERAERLDGVRSVEREGQLVRVHAARSEGVLVRLVQEAVEFGLSVRDASSLPPSLETVFLNLTGREYRE